MGVDILNRAGACGSEAQRCGLLNPRQGLDAGQDLGRKLAVDFHERDRVAARGLSADVEGRYVDVGLAEDGA